jgi:hypothetical protein
VRSPAHAHLRDVDNDTVFPLAGHASSTAAAPAWFARHYAILKEGGAASQSSSEAGTTATPVTSASWIGGKKPVIQDPSQTAHTTDAHLSQQLNASSDASEALPTESVFFDGFFSRPHKRLKYVSLGQAFIATASAPLMMMQADDGSMAASAAVAGSMVMALGWATTCAFHWFTSPYVHKLEYEPSSQMVQAYTLSIFGKEQVHCFSLDDVEYADTWKPLSTFKVSPGWCCLVPGDWCWLLAQVPAAACCGCSCRCRCCAA